MAATLRATLIGRSKGGRVEKRSQAPRFTIQRTEDSSTRATRDAMGESEIEKRTPAALAGTRASDMTETARADVVTEARPER